MLLRPISRSIATSASAPRSFAPLVAGGLCGIAFGAYALCEDDPVPVAGERIPGLAEYSRKEISEHTTAETGIWVSYKEGVYDITNFITEHPGGRDKIMLAAGGGVDPFWAVYTQHRSTLVVRTVERLRIGNVKAGDVKPVRNEDDPYSSDPERHPSLRVTCDKPFNAETPVQLIPDNFITPSDLWFTRHHHPVPVVDEAEYTLEVRASESSQPVVLSLEDLKTKFPKHTVTSTLQCAGNRRGQLNELGIGETQGLKWDVGAISTATWSGARLRDVLTAVGVDYDSGARHVQFLPLDPPYDASIPLCKALSPTGDVILAYEMNGEPLPRDHGFPVRAIVPGHVGARNVKWLASVVASAQESKSSWQSGVAYKGFGPYVKNFKGLDCSSVASVQELPVQSAICAPRNNTQLEADDFTVKGYAWSGGGRGIVRVDVSIDGGKTWKQADIKKPDQPEGQVWAWSLWSADIELPEDQKEPVEIIARAVDTSYNVQPDDARHLWNKRGILNNAWHRVTVLPAESDDD